MWDGLKSSYNVQVRLLEAERDAALFVLDAHERQADISRVNLNELQQDLTNLQRAHYSALKCIITLEAAAHDVAPGGAHQRRIVSLEADLAAARAALAAAEAAGCEQASALSMLAAAHEQVGVACMGHALMDLQLGSDTEQ